MNPLGALPARFRRQRVLIVGCGDIGLRLARQLPSRIKVMALTSSPARLPELRAQGITPLQGNLDDTRTLRRLAGLATRMVHLAPPTNEKPNARDDQRTRALLQSLRLRGLPQALVYGSTSGVYGDCEGAEIDETRAVNPHTARAWRRVDADVRCACLVGQPQCGHTSCAYRASTRLTAKAARHAGGCSKARPF